MYILLVLTDFSKWYLGIGAVAMTLMFIFVSVPMMDRHLILGKPGYQDYMMGTGGIFPRLTTPRISPSDRDAGRGRRYK